MIEVRTYIGVASACEGNARDYPVSERHAFNLLLSQEVGDEPNWSLAEETISKACWTEIDIRKTGVLSQDKVESSGEPFPAMYKHAIKYGTALLIYQGVEQ